MKNNKLVLILVLLSPVFLLKNGWPADKNNSSEMEIIEIIRSGLNDPVAGVRSLSADVLADLHDKYSLPGLKTLLNDNNDSLKIRAASALYKLGDRSGIAALRKILAASPKLSDNPTAIERARAIAKGTTRAEAARMLGEIRDFDSVHLLKRTVEDEDGRVADASLIALAKMGDSSVKNNFVSALQSVKQGVRAKAADALGEIGDAGCFPLLRKRLKDWDRDAKASAAIALGRLRDKESIPPLRELLSDKDDIVREKAAAALGMMASLEPVEDLKKALQDASGFVRISAAESLHLLGDDAGKEFLIKVLKTNEKDAKLKALAVLEKMATVKDIPDLTPLLSDEDKSIAIMSAKVIISANNSAMKR